jgi:acyl-CoA dehydrogenase
MARFRHGNLALRRRARALQPPHRDRKRRFACLAANFNEERLGLAASSIAFARLAYEQALEWARMRGAFGKPIFQHQVVRHKLVDMLQRVLASQALLELTDWHMDHGQEVVRDLCRLKNQATQTLAH